VPVTVLSAQALIDTNELRLEDYFALVPGLNVTTDDYGVPMITIRGLSTGPGTNPAVAIVVDDVPFGSSTSNANAQSVPDFDPSDLVRVEVLRGPQGTLYGASSLGGLLKYVTIDPSTAGLSGRVQVGTSSVYNGAELGYNVRGSVNVPLSDTLAIRTSGFIREDPGYIDNPVLGINGINKELVRGGRFAALYKPSEAFSLKLSALVQYTSLEGLPYADAPLDSNGGESLQQNRLRGTGQTDSTLEAYSATLTGKLGGVDIISLSGYNINKYSDTFDSTPTFGSITQYGLPGTNFNGFGVPGTLTIGLINTDKFSQEIRLSAPIGQRVEWLVGAFYEHESSATNVDLLAVNPSTAAVAGTAYQGGSPSTYAEIAGFTNLTFHVTDQFDLQVGAREGQNKQSLAQHFFAGPFVPLFYGVQPPFSYPTFYAKDNSFTYLVTPEFKVSSDFMVYARLASGYRPGGSNLAAGVPSSYKPDTTENYELGIKADFLHHALSIDASLYYIDWKDIQISLFDQTTTTSYLGNGARAKSQGVEFSVESRPLKGLTISSWVSWNDAVITQE
jgi:iron complex outermembrane receptor protein